MFACILFACILFAYSRSVRRMFGCSMFACIMFACSILVCSLFACICFACSVFVCSMFICVVRFSFKRNVVWERPFLFTGLHLIDCEFTGYLNNWDEHFEYEVPAGKAITGVISEHDNKSE